jgi:HK97 family phage prohead protease
MRGGFPPMLQKKTYKFEVKNVAEDGTFEGYASVFGVTDSDNEVVDKGAFIRTLDHNKGLVPILWQHDTKEPIGWNEFAKEDNYGLYVKGRLLIQESDRARQAHGFMKLAVELGAKPGLSIGFMVPKNGAQIKDGQRHFVEVAWKEYSVVTFPANPDAIVTGVKDEGAMANPYEALFGYVPSDEQKKQFEQAAELIKSGTFEAKAKKPAADTDDDKDPKEDKPTDHRTFDEALAAQIADAQNGYDHRHRIERALSHSIDSIKGADLNRSQKKLKITKAMHCYADAMAEWHHKQLDKEADPYGSSVMMSDANATEEQKAATLDAKKLGRKAAQARTHLKSGNALMSSGHEYMQKGYRMLNDVCRAYYANDVNLPNPAGKSADPMPKGEQEQKSSDSDIDHSLNPTELSDILKALRGE